MSWDVKQFVSVLTSWRTASHDLFFVNKFVMTSKTRHDVKKFVMKSKTYHDAKKLVKHVMTLKRSTWPWWRQKVHHDVKKFIMTSKIPERYVMTSKTSSWHQKVCHDIKGMLWRQKLHNDVKNFQSYLKCQILLLFAFVLNIFWHQFDISTMCRSRVIDDYVFFTISVTLTLTVTFPVIFLDSSGIIPRYLCVKVCNNRPTYWAGGRGYPRDPLFV